jgi:lipopolysaccharide assembly protein A
MSWLQSLITLVVTVLTLIVGILFALQNQTLVPLDLLLMQLPEQSLAVWLIAALIIGALLGMGLSAGLVWRVRRRERRRYEAKLTQLQLESEQRSVSTAVLTGREVMLRD